MNSNTPPQPHYPAHPLPAFAVSGTQRGVVAKPFGSKQAGAQESRKVENRVMPATNHSCNFRRIAQCHFCARPRPMVFHNVGFIFVMTVVC